MTVRRFFGGIIRWLAKAELEQQAAVFQAACEDAYVNGYNRGLAVGQGNMLAYLRGDQAETITTDILARRAAGMVH